MPRKRVVFEEPAIEPVVADQPVPDPQDADGEARAQRAIDIVLAQAFKSPFETRTAGDAVPISALTRQRRD